MKTIQIRVIQGAVLFAVCATLPFGAAMAEKKAAVATKAPQGAPAKPLAAGAGKPGGVRGTALPPKNFNLPRVLQRWNEIDTDKDGKVSYEDVKKVMPDFPAARFTAFDKDGDHFLSKEEAVGPAVAMPAGGLPQAEPPRPIAYLLQHGDSNHDKKISLDEFKAALPKVPETRYKELDHNGDGVIDASDMPQPGGVPAQLRAADKDGDGKVSHEEFNAAFPKAPQERFASLDRNSDGALDAGEIAGVAAVRDPAQAAAANKSWTEFLMKFIGEYDKDKDGKVTKEEFSAGHTGSAKAEFDSLDTNKDGFVTVDDKNPQANSNAKVSAAASMMAPPAEPLGGPSPAPSLPATAPASPAERFKHADKNGDGKLTYDEAAAEFKKLTPEEFKKRDTNGDGFLSPEDHPAAGQK